MTKKAMPILGSEGFVTDPDMILILGFAHYYTAHKSQDYLFRDKVRSLADTLRLYSEDIDGLTRGIEEDLRYTFINYFDIVNVDVSFTKPTLYIRLSVVDEGGKTYQLNQALNLDEARTLLTYSETGEIKS